MMQNSKREHRNCRRLITATSWIFVFLLGHKISTSRYQSTSKKGLTAELKISYCTRTRPVIDIVIGMIGVFGEDTRNASGNRLLSFLNEVELMIMVENLCLSLSGQGLGLNNRLHYNRCSVTASTGNVDVDGTDIGSSDHFLVRMELGRATKTSKACN